MQYLPIVIAALAAFHAYTYARWLRQHGNRAGAYGIYLIILIGLALPAYRMLSSGL